MAPLKLIGRGLLAHRDPLFLNIPLLLRHISFSPPTFENFGYSPEDSAFILKRLNDNSLETSQIVGEGNSKKLEVYRHKNGELQNLEDMINVHGLGLKSIKKLCDKIIASRDQVVNIKPVSSRRLNASIITPPLSSDELEKMRSVCGFHISQNFLSWAVIDSLSKTLNGWDFVNLEANTNKKGKLDLLSLISMGQSLVRNIPDSNCYVLEEQEGSIIVGNLQNKLLIHAVLSALIKEIKGERINLFFINGRAVSRWSGRLIGNEKTSSQSIVSELVLNLPGRQVDIQPHTDSRIYAEPHLRQEYSARDPFEKEALANALLLAVGFMDLVLLKRT